MKTVDNKQNANTDSCWLI